jgi:hypothetical protein
MARLQRPATEFQAYTGAQKKTGVRGRALIIGALGTAATALLVTQAEMVRSSLRIGYLQFPPAALGLLLIVIALGRGARRISTRWGLSSSDLLIIYSMMLVGAMTSSHGIVEKWIPLLVAPKYLANDTNHWQSLIQQRLPPWLFPTLPHAAGTKDPAAQWYYEKLPRGLSIPWEAWVVPVFSTLIIILLVVFAFLCLATILRRQWVDSEKLSFPLAQLPLEIAGDADHPSFFSNRLMWLGALLPIAIYGLNGLHQVQPSVPAIPLRWATSDFLTTPPWNGISYTDIVISFSAIGFFFLLPTDVLFSIWFFFMLTRVQEVIAIAYNMDQPGMPIYPMPVFVGYQSMGAYFVLSGYFFWIARPHLKRVWAAALGREKADDADELLPYRVAVWGLFACIILSAIWLYAIGMSPWLALLELCVFLFITAIVMARSTAEAGMLMTETSFRPIDIYRLFGSVHALGPSNLAALAFFDNLFLRDQRGLLLTGFLDVGRLTDGARVQRRSFTGALLLGIGIALVVAGGLNIALPYHLGANSMDSWMENGSPTITYGDYQPYFSPNPPLEVTQAWQRPAFFVIGLGVTLFLTLMRSAFFWWPLHPLGYAIAGSWSTVEFWFPCLIAWVLKGLTVRYGGIGLYQRLRPVFLGLILGEFGMAVFYAILNALTAWLTPLHEFPPPPLPWG